jgi:hypothetical protein
MCGCTSMSSAITLSPTLSEKTLTCITPLASSATQPTSESDMRTLSNILPSSVLGSWACLQDCYFMVYTSLSISPHTTKSSSLHRTNTSTQTPSRRDAYYTSESFTSCHSCFTGLHGRRSLSPYCLSTSCLCASWCLVRSIISHPNLPINLTRIFSNIKSSPPATSPLKVTYYSCLQEG